MKLRIPLILLLVLLTAQLLLLVYNARQNRQLVEQARSNLAVLQDNLQTERRRLNREKEKYRQIIAAIPTSVLMGFEDPEAVFAGFLDYLNSGVLATVGARVVMQNQLRFTPKPVPMRTSDFRFDFSFLTIAQAEGFLDFLLVQRLYPVRVRQLRITGGKNALEQKVKGELDLTLMIPDKLIFAGDQRQNPAGKRQ